MMNDLDIKDIAIAIRDQVRVRCQHHGVNVSSDDLQETVNFIDAILSKYADNSMVDNYTLNPQTGQREELDDGDARPVRLE